MAEVETSDLRNIDLREQEQELEDVSLGENGEDTSIVEEEPPLRPLSMNPPTPLSQRASGDTERGEANTEDKDSDDETTNNEWADAASQPPPSLPQDTPRTADTPGEGPPSSPRHRTDSQSTIATSATKQSTRSSLVFVNTALETIAASKDARKNKKLGEVIQEALSAIKTADGDPSQLNPETLFAPLQLASEANTTATVITALDCIGKLISYSYFSTPEPSAEAPEGPPLIERAIDAICECFQGEATPVEIQLQIVKSLLAAILNDKVVVHGAGLLKAIRLTYNVFLLSKSSANQQVAQGALTQMVGTVFGRVKTRLTMKETRLNLSHVSLGNSGSENGRSSADRIEDEGENGAKGDEESDDQEDDGEEIPAHPRDVPVERHDTPKITLQTFEKDVSFNDDTIQDNAPTLVTKVKRPHTYSRSMSGREVTPGGHDTVDEEEEDEIFITDAYLVFRAMCRLSTKSIQVEHAHDVRSHGMRSKLFSLHIIHTILHNNVSVFLSPHATIKSKTGEEPTPFIQAIKSYLCLSLSRNGASSVNKVFEVSCEIFWMMLKYLRVMLKKEIEVFLKEIYLAILEKKNAAAFQKQYFMTVLSRLAADPRAIVEIYLNYDCDRTALDNMYQRIVEHLSRISSSPVTVTSTQLHVYHESHIKTSHLSDWQSRGTLPPSLATTSISTAPEIEQGFPAEYALKQESLEALVGILRSLVNWSQQQIPDLSNTLGDPDSRNSYDESRNSMENRDGGHFPFSGAVGGDTASGASTPLAEDDPSQLERAKQRKTALTNAVRQFNFKPKKGIKLLLKEGFIRTDSPQDIASFMLGNEFIDKKALGEYLGEGDTENVAIMHAFVDNMDFTRMRFVDALRRFLQSFRLPGEAQKIDRFMLKFAERYISGNPGAFANADTAYVLAYSVIMLNTDQHSTKLKGRRMTPEDFIKNNRGINDGQDLPDEYLRGIYDEISHNEIVLDTERETAANLGLVQQPTGGLASNISQAFSTVGRDLQKEAYMQASEEMANKTEQLYKNLLRAQRRGASRLPVSKFIPASSSKHVGPMFDVTWMPFLTALSGQAQESADAETVKLCMEGLRLAIRVSCLFDLENPRQAFVSTLSRFTNLYNLSEMKAKNVEALKVLLEVAYTEGNHLREAWRDILTCISQLDRFQLISTGVDQNAVPDVLKSNLTPPQPQSKKNLQVPNKARHRSQSHLQYQSDIAEESRSADMVRSVDKIFTNTANLSGEAIVHFVTALVQVSWQEIQSSGQSESPRTYSLQKLVEISGYNMTRVRFEWTNIWQVLGDHFIQVGCHTNTNVVYFALNSLRQLSMRFMEIEELPGFKFQKDFLKPFEHIIANTSVVPVKDMVLRCLIQMILARGENIRSGWRTMFGVFAVAAKEPYEGIVNLAFDNITQVYNTRFGVVISQGAFADLIICLTEFSKNHKFQKKSLQAIETLKSSVPKMLRTPECPLAASSGLPQDSSQASGIPKQPTRQTQEEQFWFPVLFAFHDVLMTGEDLEVRSRALSYLFETLMRYGGDFPQEFWDTLWRQLLYPIFMVLKSKSEMSKVLNHEELSVWLSTTMIQALRHMITLFTHFFDSLGYMLDRFLDLLALCICQENDTLARIGSNCLQQLVLQNVNKFEPEHWHKIVNAFVELFSRTEATGLFSATTYSPSVTSPSESRQNSVSSEPNKGSVSEETPDVASERAESNDNALGINGLNSAQKSPSVTTDDGEQSPTSIRLPSPLPPKHRTTDLEDYNPESSAQQASVPVTAARRRFFNQIITKCVLQLLMIETVQELFTNQAVYDKIPSAEILRLMAVLKRSYVFAKRFNGDRELRTRLFKEGFMRQPPNLLKQESGSAAVYVTILFRMFHDKSTERAASKAETEAALIPLCEDIIRSYIALDVETQQRNIMTWRPVVVNVLDGFASFSNEDVKRLSDILAQVVVGILGTELNNDIQRALQAVSKKMFEVSLGIQGLDEVMGGMIMTPIGDRSNSFTTSGSRKGSR